MKTDFSRLDPPTAEQIKVFTDALGAGFDLSKLNRLGAKPGLSRKIAIEFSNLKQALVKPVKSLSIKAQAVFASTIIAINPMGVSVAHADSQSTGPAKSFKVASLGGFGTLGGVSTIKFTDSNDRSVSRPLATPPQPATPTAPVSPQITPVAKPATIPPATKPNQPIAKRQQSAPRQAIVTQKRTQSQTMPTAKTKPAHHNDRLKKLAEQTIAQPQQKGFFESLFGGLQQSSPQTALAYAAPEPSVVQPSVRQMFQPNIRAGDAVYNISKHTVYMPDGSQLEAHSGLGPMLDNPNYVSQRMRGSTVPGTYNLTLREAPFHGVKALRLVPTNQQMYGRFGLLAHTFMLGPMGDSNGCVSFRNYQAFLSAYEHGQVKRLIVVPDGTGAAPAIYADMNGQSAAPMQPHRHHHKKVWHYRHSFVQTARL